MATVGVAAVTTVGAARRRGLGHRDVAVQHRLLPTVSGPRPTPDQPRTVSVFAPATSRRAHGARRDHLSVPAVSRYP